MNFMPRTVSGDQIGHPGELLIRDQHKARIVVQLLCNLVFPASQSSERRIQVRHAIFDLLIPGGKCVLWRHYQQSLVVMRAVEKGGQGFCRLASSRHRKRRGGWQCSDLAHVAGLFWGQIAGKA